MKYLIFGAGGFLGSALVKHLQRAGEAVYSVVRSPSKASHTFAVDISQAQAFEAISVQPDIIINCASALPDPARGFSDPEYLRQLHETNVVGGANIMNWAADRGIQKVINCSTLVVVDKPWPVPLTEEANTYPQGRHVAYCTSKLSQELVMNAVAEAHGLQLLHLRISALYGPGMKGGGILTKLIQQSSAGEQIQLTNASKVFFDFLYVDDAVKTIYHLSQADRWQHQVVNLASGEEISLLQLAKVVCRLGGKREDHIISVEAEGVASRAVVDTSRLENYLSGSGIQLRPFAEKVKSMMPH